MHMIAKALDSHSLCSVYEGLELDECDICGAVVSDADLHADWHEAMRVK